MYLSQVEGRARLSLSVYTHLLYLLLYSFDKGTALVSTVVVKGCKIIVLKNESLSVHYDMLNNLI